MAINAALFAAQMWLSQITRPRPQRFTFEDLLESTNKGDETRPIPYVRGKWKTKPQRIWLGDFQARAVERDSHWTDYLWASALAGLLDFITVSYRYYVGQGFALTWGPINRVHQVYADDLPCAVSPVVDNAGGSILLDDPGLFGGDQPPGLGGVFATCDVIAGNYTQGRNAYLVSQEGNVPALRGVAALIIRGPSGATESGYFSADQLTIHEWHVELMAWPDVLNSGNARLADDSYNRIHAMWEWATSADFGAEFPVARIHRPSWLAAAATCFTDGLGFSGEINTGGNVGEVFDQLKASVDAETYEHPRDGLKIKLVRKDYSIPLLKVLDETNTDVIEEYTPGDNADTFNSTTVEYVDASNNYQPRPAVYKDPANRTLQQRNAPRTLTFPGVASAELAQKLATREGRAGAQPLPPLIVNAGEDARELWPGEVFHFQWRDPLVRKMFRVHARTPSVAYDGSRSFRIVSTEDQYSIGMSVFGTPSGTGATNPADIWDTAPPSASFDSALIPPDGLEHDFVEGIGGNTQSTIHGAIIFGSYAGGQYARVYVTEPGGIETLSPMRLVPDTDNKAQFVWPAGESGTYTFCVQTFAIVTDATNGVKVCASIGAASFSVSPSASQSPSASASPSISPSSSLSPSASVSPSGSASSSTSPSASASASVSPSSSQSPSQSVSPSASVSPSSSASPSASGPDAIPNIWDWWEPRLEGLANNDPIGTLTGQFAANNFTASGTARPTYLTAILNGEGVGQWDGSSDLMTGVNPSALTAGHLFLLVKVDADPPPGVGTSGLWRVGTAAFDDHYPFNTDSKVYMGAGSNTRRTCTNPTLSLADWRLLEIVTTSSEYTVQLDGTESLFTSGTNTVAFRTDFNLGRGVTSTVWFKGQIAGMYLFSAKLGATDRGTLVSYVNTEFGTSFS